MSLRHTSWWRLVVLDIRNALFLSFSYESVKYIMVPISAKKPTPIAMVPITLHTALPVTTGCNRHQPIPHSIPIITNSVFIIVCAYSFCDKCILGRYKSSFPYDVSIPCRSHSDRTWTQDGIQPHSWGNSVPGQPRMLGLSCLPIVVIRSSV